MRKGQNGQDGDTNNEDKDGNKDVVVQLMNNDKDTCQRDPRHGCHLVQALVAGKLGRVARQDS